MVSSNITMNMTVESENLFVGDISVTVGTPLSEPDLLGPQYHQTVRISILIIMITFSVIGNCVVCWRLVPVRRRRYPKSKILFLNLAIADLFVTLIAMTSQLVWEVMGRIWIAGDAFCRIFKLLQTFSLVSSTYMLVSIAADRHGAIVRPMSRCPSSRNLAIGAWLASFVPSLPCIVVFREVRLDENSSYCTSLFYTGEYPQYYRQIYMAFVFLTVFIGPFVLLVCLYTGILLKIWTQSSAFSSAEQSSSSLPRAKIKTLKMTIVIFVTFMVTNVPYVVQEMILAFGESNLLNPNTVALFGVISASNSAINPYIFLAFQCKESCLVCLCRALSFFVCCPSWKKLIKSSGSAMGSIRQRQNSVTSGSSKTSTKIVTNGQHLCDQSLQSKPKTKLFIRSKAETFL